MKTPLIAPERVRADVAVGMVVFLAAWTMWFAALLIAALSLRQAGSGGAIVSSAGPVIWAVATALAVTSSVAMVAGRHRLALLFALGFVLTQGLLLAGASDIAASRARSITMLLAGFHAVHALVCVAGVGRALARGKVPTHWATFWHTLAIAWLLICGVLFL